MESNTYTQKVAGVLSICRGIKNNPNDLDSTKKLYYSIKEIENIVNNLTQSQAQQYKLELTESVRKMELAGASPSDTILNAYKSAIAYLEYYRNCRINYYLNGEKPNADFLLENIFNASDYASQFLDGTYSQEQYFYIKNILLGLEAEAIKDHAMKVAGVNSLVLYGFNPDILCENLVKENYAQIAVHGPISEEQNESFNYYKFNIKDSKGQRYGTPLGKPYDNYAYGIFFDNCVKATILQDYFINNLQQIAKTGKLKGFFYTFTGDELQTFVNKNISKFKANKKQIASVQNSNQTRLEKLMSGYGS